MGFGNLKAIADDDFVDAGSSQEPLEVAVIVTGKGTGVCPFRAVVHGDTDDGAIVLANDNLVRFQNDRPAATNTLGRNEFDDQALLRWRTSAAIAPAQLPLWASLVLVVL